MKFSSEVKIGLIGILTLLVLIWGVNYLKGKNILSQRYVLYTYLEDSGKLETSAPVLFKGVKIGYVDQVRLKPEEAPAIEVILSIDKDFPLHQGTLASLSSADLLGTKAIGIIDPGKGPYLKSRDTIGSVVEEDLISSLSSQILPVADQIGKLAGSVDSLVSQLNTASLNQSLQNLEDLSASLRQAMEPGGSVYESMNHLEGFSMMLDKQKDTLASTSNHIRSLTSELDQIDFSSLFDKLDQTSTELAQIATQVNSGQGSAGKLLYSDSLYLSLELLLKNLDQLVRDLNENPQDYVHFSLFGRKKE